MKKTSRIQKSLFSVLVLILVAFAVSRFSTIISLAAGTGTFDDPYTTKDDVIKYVRQQRVARVNDIRCYYYPEGGPEGNLLAVAKEISDASLEHTGVPNEGDYLVLNGLQYGYGYDYDGDHDPDTGKITHIPVNKDGHMVPILTFPSTYRSTAEQEAQVAALLDAEVAKYARYSPYKKVDELHYYEYERVDYDYDFNNYSTYNAAIERLSVCQGYASMFYYMMLKAGVNCRVITGDGLSGETWGAHAWNIVELEGKWYNVDVTWDSNLKQYTPRKYLLVLEPEFSKDHRRADKYTTDEFNAAYPMATEPASGLSDYLMGCNVLIKDDIVLNWFISFPEDIDKQSATVTFSFPGEGDLYAQPMKLSDVSAVDIRNLGGRNVYTFKCAVPAYKMCDDILATVKFDDATLATYTVSIKEYADALLKDENFQSEQNSYYCTILKALLYYGKYAQAYFNPSATGNPAENAGADPVPAYVPNTSLGTGFTRPTSTDDNISYYGSSLILRDNVTMRHYFLLKDKSTLDTYTFKYGANTATEIKTDKKNPNLVYFDTDSINYNYLKSGTISNSRQIRVIAGENTVIDYNYNPVDYVKVVMDKYNNPDDSSISDDVANLLKAFCYYTETLYNN